MIFIIIKHMKKLILFLFIMTLISSCNNRKFKYRIDGTVTVNDTIHPAIWYTDTISFDKDTAYYYNSDGSEVRIYPPFTLKRYE